MISEIVEEVFKIIWHERMQSDEGIAIDKNERSEKKFLNEKMNSLLFYSSEI